MAYKLGREVSAIYRYHFYPIGGILLVVSLGEATCSYRDACVLCYSHCFSSNEVGFVVIGSTMAAVPSGTFLAGSNELLHTQHHHHHTIYLYLSRSESTIIYFAQSTKFSIRIYHKHGTSNT